MLVKVGISNRHVHLSKEDYKLLFGNQVLTKRNDLSQKGQFASNLTVTIMGDKGKIENVRVMGPLRDYTQVEVSRTDSFVLGVNPPVRNSGCLDGASLITIINKDKIIKRKACIIATRHIHMTEDFKKKHDLGDVCKIRVDKGKPTVLDGVFVRTDPSYSFELHLDYDDANSCMLNQQDEVEIVV